MMRKACMAETGVEEKYIEQSKNGNLPDAPGLRCYVLCLFEHAGMIEENGNIHFDRVMHLLPESNQETVRKVTQECKTIRKENIYIIFF